MIYACLLVSALFASFILIIAVIHFYTQQIHNEVIMNIFGGETISKSLREILYVIYLNFNNAF